MFAVDHALTALLIKRRYREAPIGPILLSVQAMELAWVALNYCGIERTDADLQVHSVADIHLSYMPYSHSEATACGAAALTWQGMSTPSSRRTSAACPNAGKGEPRAGRRTRRKRTPT